MDETVKKERTIKDLELELLQVQNSILDLQSKARLLEGALTELASMARHTETNTTEIVVFFRKAKIIFSFLEFLGKIASPLGWLLGGIIAAGAMSGQLKSSILALFK